jgi:hypothetical protein
MGNIFSKNSIYVYHALLLLFPFAVLIVLVYFDFSIVIRNIVFALSWFVSLAAMWSRKIRLVIDR